MKTASLENNRHSLAHLLAAAVMELYPDAKRTIGPAIDNGFFYDFQFTKPISDSDLPSIEKKKDRLFQGGTKLKKSRAGERKAKKELDDYLKLQEEAKKRDHKKLGPELDLFTFSELVGAGLPLWTPRGTLIRTLLDDFVWELRKKFGYHRVEIPHITKKDLYEKSGHWDKFKNELFRIQTREGHLFAMKPMNCPHHTQIYARRPWSYS